MGEAKKIGPIVEDTTVVGGVDIHGAPVIRPKTPDGRADESVRPTDRREGGDPRNGDSPRSVTGSGGNP